MYFATVSCIQECLKHILLQSYIIKQHEPFFFPSSYQICLITVNSQFRRSLSLSVVIQLLSCFQKQHHFVWKLGNKNKNKTKCVSFFFPSGLQWVG